MRYFTILILLLINSSPLLAQTILTIEGTVTNSAEPGNWGGVNISRNQPTTFTFRNNSITSVNASGYMLQAGDESVYGSNNNLSGEIISGNSLLWNGTDPTSITHGVFTGFNLNATVIYNYLNKVPMSLIRKSNGMTNTSGGVAYNIVKNPQAVAVVVKGMNGVNIFNNTFFSDQIMYTGPGIGTSRGLVDVYTNTDITPSAASTGTKIKNNIFYTKNQIYNIFIYDAGCLPGFESDYNIFYCESGVPIFNYLGAVKTFTQWQALGFDTHSVVVNPNFNNFTDFVPASRLDYGTNLGSTWQTGLSTTASWIVGSSPETALQNGAWQVGARIYSSQVVPVSGITITGQSGATSITSDNGSLQLSASVLPDNASDKTVIWSVVNGTGQATISSTGLVTAMDNGTITARATAHDGSGVYGTIVITISNQILPVTGIVVSGAGGASSINTNKGSLQLSATVLPVNATDNSVIWSIVNGTGQATINPGGLVTAIDNGTVTAKATAHDGSSVVGTLVISISKQIVPVSGITVTGSGGVTSITIDNGTLQLSEEVLPANATDKTVTWSVVTGTNLATISSAGLLTALDNGVVTVRATANDGSGIYGSIAITITNQIIAVTGITVSTSGGISSIIIDKASLQLLAAVLPNNASDKTITWSVVNGTELATVNSSGLVTAIDNGIVTVRALANDGSAVYGTYVITISNQFLPVTGITVSGAGGATTISTNNGSLQLIAAVLPANATDKSLIWSLINGSGAATINTTGLVTAVDNGIITAVASANDGSGIAGTLDITISNQIIPVSGIAITGAGGISAITTDKGSLQLSAAILPINATNKSITWALVNGAGNATVNSTGLVTAIENGSVTVKATANDGSGIFSTIIVTISNQITHVTNILVTGTGGATIITTINGSLQLITDILPVNATDKTVTWSVINGTGQASINSSGLVTAVSEGTITAQASANDGSGVIGNLIIKISTSLIPVTGITVTGAGGLSSITTDKGSLQLSTDVLPVNATDNSVTWSISNGATFANINSTGLVTALADGTITARATANDGSGVYGTLSLTISNQIVKVTGITVAGAGGISSITTDNGTLQLLETVLPTDAKIKNVTWSITDVTGQADISPTGIVTAIDNGTVEARATANDGSGVYGTFLITISNQIVPVTGISVYGSGGLSTITVDKGSLQLGETLLPVNATDKNVTWSLVNGTGQAVINASGLVIAINNGTVTAIATANDASGVFGTMIITISNQIVLVNGITVTGEGGITSINTDKGSLQLSADVLPLNATDKSVSWSIVNGSGLATLSATGLLTAIYNGTVTIRTSANDGSGIYGTLVMTISNQIVLVSGITVNGSGGSTTIRTDNGSLQLSATVLPANATNKTVVWSIVNGTGQAVISSSGRVTAVDNGTVTARATTADGSGIYGTLVITISNQIIPVTGITVAAAGGISAITSDNGSLQLSAAVLPSNATNKTVIWTVINVTGQAIISSSGLLSALDNGTVTARATAADGSGIFGTIVLTLSNQIVPVTSISVTGAAGATILTSDNGSLQLIASVLPVNASDKSVTWSILNGTGEATMNSTGVVTAVYNGTVTARATANDGSGVISNLVISIFNQIIPVSSITVAGAGGLSAIATDNGTLQLSASVLPDRSTDKTVTWSVVNGTGRASIDATGLVTALDNGTVTAIAMANDASGVFGSKVITISNQTGPVTSITITSSGGSNTITTDNGSLQLNAAVLPANATVKTVTWSFNNSMSLATINASGLVTAVDNGVVTARATARDGSGVYGTYVITISNQLVPVTGITVSGAGGSSSIAIDNGSLQLTASVLPVNALNKSVTWSVFNDSGQASISPSGILTAIGNGIVTARATANDNSGIYGILLITISNQITPVSNISITGTGGSSSITNDDGTLQLTANITPVNASNKTVTWSIVNGTGQASINGTGLVTAIINGTVTAIATANDGSGVYGTLLISLSNQIVEVTNITISGTGGVNSIDTDNGTLQLVAMVLPVNATNKSVVWSLANGTELAAISYDGFVTASDNGIITVRATATDGSGTYGNIIINISGQMIPVSGIKVTGTDGTMVITKYNKKLQLLATILPSNATDKTITWSLAKGVDLATISSNGLVTAVENGIITAKATANDGSGIYGLMDIPIIIENSELKPVFVTKNEIRIPLNSGYISWKAGLYNSRGALVLSDIVKSDVFVFDISALSSGVYIVVLSKGENIRIAKVIKP
jgi:uncharacterized protein YjdB